MYNDMKDLIKSILGLLLWGAIAFALGWGVCRRVAKANPETVEVHDSLIVTRIDTLIFEKPVYVASYVHDTVATYFTTIEHDTVLVEVPIETRVYEEDSLYRAVVSGWQPELKELTIFPTTTTITITEKVKTKPPKFSFGLTVGPGIVITPQSETYGGLGITAGLQYRF